MTGAGARAAGGDAVPLGPARTPRPPHTSIGRGPGVALALVVALVLAAALANLVRVDKVAYYPGPVFNTLGTIDGKQVVTVEGEETYPTSGELLFTTIQVEGRPGDRLTLWEWLRASADPTTTVVPFDAVYAPDQTADQVREVNTQLMEHSQEDAAVVALRADGLTVPEEVLVAQIIKDAPADGVLEVDDRIISADGKKVTDSVALREHIQGVEPGESVHLVVDRGGRRKELDVPTKKDEESGRTIVGVYLAPRYDLPADVTIDAGAVGGPSAGLMFSLAVYDKITPGELTGGKKIAGTGTIDGQGGVGPIGGIKQKLHAAAEADAEVFLAPADNCDEVVGEVPDGLTVVKVATFDEAEGYLEKLAKVEDPASLGLPTCTAG